MIIKIYELVSGKPESISTEYDPLKENLHFADCFYTKNIKFEGVIALEDEILTLRGTLFAECRMTCARCLKEEIISLDKVVDLFYDIDGKSELDATGDILEILVFEHEQKYLCKDDCKGLCPNCGINLNVGNCDCQQNIPNEQMLKLKKLFNDKEKEK